MRHRIDTIDWLPTYKFFVLREVINGRVLYAAKMDGRVFASSPSREKALQTLLLRVAEEMVH